MPTKKDKLTKEEQIKILQESNKMIKKTMQETIERGDKANSLALIKQALDENYSQMVAIDPSLKDKVKSLMYNENIEASKENLEGSDVSFDFSDNYSDNSNSNKEIVMNEDVNVIEQNNDIEVDNNNNKEVKVNEIDSNYYFDVKDKNLAYDVIPLPSKGEVYKEKIPKLSVAYLTAESENLITSPHLYKDDLIVDALLKYHIQNKGFNTDELISGDVDAILLWLRATGYGNDYPVVVTDPETGKDFDVKVDLTKIKIKDFDLIGDENGYFDFTLPISKVVVKFKYLSRKEEKKLKQINSMESDESRKSLVRQDYQSLIQCLNNETDMDNDKKDKIKNYLNAIEDLWLNGSVSNKIKVNRLITNRLDMSVMSVNGNTDKKYIKEFIRRMPARDSLELRKYIEQHKPGVDWNVEVEKPQSLGGGSVNIFLEWGTDAFFNIV